MRSLVAAQVRFAVAGGLAVGLHGFVRTTKDIDLIAHPEDLDKIRIVLLREGYRENAHPISFRNSGLKLRRFWRRLPKMEELLMVDVLLVESERTAKMLKRVRCMRYADLRLPVTSRADLIEMKRLRGSKQDEADIEKLVKRRGRKKKTDHPR